MPWAKANLNNDNILFVVICIVCTKMECKEKLFVPKWDSLEKHVRKKRNESRQKVIDMKCEHAKNEVQYVAMNVYLSSTCCNSVLCLKIRKK
jgi:hypothetical protein